MAQKNESSFWKLLAGIRGGITITVPNKFKLPAEYQKFDLPTIFDAWGILYNSVRGGKTKLYLPKGWQVKYLADFLHVHDAKGALRMRVLTESVSIELPVVTTMEGDYETTNWVAVFHRGEEVFRSSTFKHGELPESPDMYEFLKELVPPENPAWDNYQAPPIPDSEEEREEANRQAYLALEPYYDEAEAFVREHYPLLDQDPNAYW